MFWLFKRWLALLTFAISGFVFPAHLQRIYRATDQEKS